MQKPENISQTNWNNLLWVIKTLNEDFESKQSAIIKELGHDPGHDIGDACDPIELLGNQPTQDESFEEDGDRELYISTITAISKVLRAKRQSDIILAIDSLHSIPESWKSLRVNYC